MSAFLPVLTQRRKYPHLPTFPVLISSGESQSQSTECDNIPVLSLRVLSWSRKTNMIQKLGKMGTNKRFMLCFYETQIIIKRNPDSLEVCVTQG